MVFKKLGIDVTVDEIVSASYMAAAFCTEQIPTAKVLLLGNSGIEDEMRLAVRINHLC